MHVSKQTAIESTLLSKPQHLLRLAPTRSRNSVKFKTTAATAAFAAALLSGGVIAASAQTVTFVGDAAPTASDPFYTYTYSVTAAPYYLFSFADENVTGPGTMLSPGSFLESPAPAGDFVFASYDAPSADELTVVTSGNKSFELTGPAPATMTATPEPSAMVSMSILGACLGLGIVAKRRKSMAS